MSEKLTEAQRAAAEFAGKQRAFGLTHGDMEKIREEQIHGTTRMIPANNATGIPDEVFREHYEGYMIPWHEEMHYHIALEARLWDTSGAKPARLSQCHVQVYTKADYDLLINMKPDNGFKGYITHILHNPELVGKTSIDYGKEKSQTVVSVGTPDNLKHLTTVKEAKQYYRELTGNEPVRVWTFEKTIAAIQSYLDTQK